MPRPPSRLLAPALTLLAFLFLSPALATAFPQGAAERLETTSPGFFTKLWVFLTATSTHGSLGISCVTAGSCTSSGSGSDPNKSSSGDNGSGLDPDG